MDEFDVGDGGVVLCCNFLFELFDVGGHSHINIKFKRLLLGWGFEAQSYHL